MKYESRVVNFLPARRTVKPGAERGQALRPPRRTSGEREVKDPWRPDPTPGQGASQCRAGCSSRPPDAAHLGWFVAGAIAQVVFIFLVAALSRSFSTRWFTDSSGCTCLAIWASFWSTWIRRARRPGRRPRVAAHGSQLRTLSAALPGMARPGQRHHRPPAAAATRADLHRRRRPDTQRPTALAGRIPQFTGNMVTIGVTVVRQSPTSSSSS